jgi:hypothetical protein
VTQGADWPTDELRGVLQDHDVRILGRERRRTAPAPWWLRSMRTVDGRFVYDSDATWTETHYTFRRQMVCEVCHQAFGYNFEVDQVSRIHREGRRTDGALRQELGRQLRRRIRCPHCRTIQREPRRTLRRADRMQSGLSCGLILLDLLLFVALGALGGLLAGLAGFFVGVLLALGCVLVLWYFAFPYVLGMGPDI